MMILGDVDVFVEPVWPWSIPGIGLPAMAGIALVLVGITIWTYLGVARVTWSRLALVLSLRLGALALAFAMMLRPSLGSTHPEGVEASKLFVVFDASASMNVDDGPGKATRWEQVNRLWQSRSVQRRVQELADEQKLEVVKYLAADDLRPDEPEASATGKRTDIGMWLHRLRQKHGHEKHLRGIVLFSDGGDNGTRFATLTEARGWRGVCPIYTFGAGNPGDPRFGKDIALTHVDAPGQIAVKSKKDIKVIVQAPGFEKSEVDVSVWMEMLGAKEAQKVGENLKFRIARTKNQEIVVKCDMPELPGEYRLTAKVAPLPEEANKQNNEISTFVQVVKPEINVLWVDRPRVYEPTFALRALASDKRIRVHFATPSAEGKQDPVEFYRLDRQHYDVVVIGDLAARQFSLGQPGKIFERIKQMVEKERTGLLVLGGTETFASGGWEKYPALMDLMPAAFAKKEVSKTVRVAPTKEGLSQYPFLQLDPDPKKNEELWSKEFDEFEELTPLGDAAAGSAILIKTEKGEIVMASTRRGEGRVVAFAADTTWKAWTTSPPAVQGYRRFWKQLVFWLAQQQDQSNRLWIELDRRRIGASASDSLGFTFGLRGKTGVEVAGATFEAHVAPADGAKEYPVRLFREGSSHRGAFAGDHEPGEYKLVIRGKGSDVDGSAVSEKNSVRFLIEAEDVEMARPAADHELLAKISAASEGRFNPAEEAFLLEYLDALKNQVNGESRMKTTHWPDWKSVPTSEHVRDQLAGLWSSFSALGFVLFVFLLGGEWCLRRWWGLA